MNILTEVEKNIIIGLKKSLILENPPFLTQERFDLIVEVLIKDDCRESMWRLCGSYSNYNFNKVIDYFV